MTFAFFYVFLLLLCLEQEEEQQQQRSSLPCPRPESRLCTFDDGLEVEDAGHSAAFRRQLFEAFLEDKERVDGPEDGEHHGGREDEVVVVQPASDLHSDNVTQAEQKLYQIIKHI